MLVDLNRIKTVGGQEDLIEDVAMDMAKAAAEGQGAKKRLMDTLRTNGKTSECLARKTFQDVRQQPMNVTRKHLDIDP